MSTDRYLKDNIVSFRLLIHKADVQWYVAGHKSGFWFEESLLCMVMLTQGSPQWCNLTEIPTLAFGQKFEVWTRESQKGN